MPSNVYPDLPEPRGKRRSNRVWPSPCPLRVRGVVCGGEIVTQDNYGPVRDEHGNPDWTRRYRMWRCVRCSKLYYQETFRVLLDPDNLQPLVGEHTLEAARDPYTKL